MKVEELPETAANGMTIASILMPFRFDCICPLIASASASDTFDSWEILALNRDATFNAFMPMNPSTPSRFVLVTFDSLHPEAEANTTRGAALTAKRLFWENFLEACAPFKPHTLWEVHRDIFLEVSE